MAEEFIILGKIHGSSSKQIAKTEPERSSIDWNKAVCVVCAQNSEFVEVTMDERIIDDTKQYIHDLFRDNSDGHGVKHSLKGY